MISSVAKPDDEPPSTNSGRGLGRLSTLFLSGVMGVAVVGYFVGLADGVPQPDGLETTPWLISEASRGPDPHSQAVKAVHYADIPATAMGPTDAWRETPKHFPHPAYDLFAEIQPNPVDKQRSSAERSLRRAFNGAPPTIPHAIEGTSDAACYACHSQGMQLGGVKASVMSHRFLANCTQCHAPPAPAIFAQEDVQVETTFVGLPAPSAGKRAFPGAPPTIPHSQWMRENCMACHGGPNGWAGMESTHPWRVNCTQCHAPSARLDQAIAGPSAAMLPALNVE